MRRRLLWLLASGVWLATCATAPAHHSAAMFDAENPIELTGTVREFKYTSPHTFIFLEVKETGGGTKVWTLEGNVPSNLVREGWLHDTLKPGDEIKPGGTRPIAPRCIVARGALPNGSASCLFA